MAETETHADESQDKKKFRENYQVDKIAVMRDQIIKEVRFRHLKTTPEGEQFEDMVDAFCEHMPSSVLRETVYDSVQDLAGERLTTLKLWSTAYRLAANLPRLRRNTPVPTWTMQRDIEWVPAQVISAKRGRSKGRARKLGTHFKFQILAGTACPNYTSAFWTDSFVWALVREPVGFSKRNRVPKSGAPLERSFQSPNELVNMRLMLLLEPEHSDSVQPGFEKIDITPSLLKHNHDLMDKRDRIKPGYRCPQGFGPDVACHRCYAGYTTCPAGTHPTDYTFDYCSECGQGNVAFDKTLSKHCCLHCFEKRQTERKD